MSEPGPVVGARDSGGRDRRSLVQAVDEVLIGGGRSSRFALLHETRTVPIVFVSVSDPVGDRFVNASPGLVATSPA